MSRASSALPPRLLLVALLLGASPFLGCASVGNPDPLEGYNRAVFGFNNFLDQRALKPAGQGWTFVTHQRMRSSLTNFFFNLGFPRRFVANLLTARVRDAGVELSRFAVNTTVGVAGLFDPMGHWGVEPRDEDFGLAFGRWGIGPGAYFILPVVTAASTYRDSVGWVFDTALDGGTWLGIFVAPGLGVLDSINQRAENASRIAAAREASLDYYVFVRNAFLQYRQRRIRGRPSEGDDDDLYDFEDWDEDEDRD